MDEPLSNLDAKLRNQMRAEIIKLRSRINTTFVYVTHDQTEAMTLGDRIVIMRDGFIQQIGTPQEVFNHPKNLFVAGFIGTPQMNFFPDAKLTVKDGKYVATVQGKDFELPADKQEALKAMADVPSEIIVGVRPVHVHLADDGIDATVDVSELDWAPSCICMSTPPARTLSSSSRPRISTSPPSMAATSPSSIRSVRS